MKTLEEFISESLINEALTGDALVKNSSKRVGKAQGDAGCEAMAEAIEIKFGKELKDDINNLNDSLKKQKLTGPAFVFAICNIVVGSTHDSGRGASCCLDQFSVEDINGKKHLVWTNGKKKFYVDPDTGSDWQPLQ